MNRDRQASIDRQIAEQAAEWLEAVRSEAQPQVCAAFAEWIQASPRHLEEFLFISALDSELERMDPDRQINVQALKSLVAVNVLPLERPQSAASDAGAVLATKATRLDRPQLMTARVYRIAAGLAAIALAATLVALAYRYVRGHDGHTTDIGKQRTIELADGSVLQLNAKSYIETELSTTGRDIKLIICDRGAAALVYERAN